MANDFALPGKELHMTEPLPRSRGQDRMLDVRVPARPEAVAEVRHELDRLGLPDPGMNDVRLLVSELVTNSVKHAELRTGDQIRVTARWSDEIIRVDVFDRTNAPPREDHVAGGIRPGPGAESGWGLFLLDQLASRWGNTTGHYWFEMPLRSNGASTVNA
jgi:anti-sigma regulatory factor (Ser/Thr protein kinase)